jgi:DedD protein
MEEGAKRRLVGAAVMVLLLVIFLPMLLEEEDPSPVTERDLSIPPRPDFDQGFDASVADGPDDPDVSEKPERSDSDSRDSRPLPQELPAPALFDAPATAEPAFEPASESPPILVGKERPAREQTEPSSKPEVVSAPEPTQKADSASEQASASLSSWVVQVASVKDLKRAKSLEQELRGKGFPAFIEQAEVKQALWHRIRVGPEASRQRIESMAASIKEKTGLQGQVQRYP